MEDLAYLAKRKWGEGESGGTTPRVSSIYSESRVGFSFGVGPGNQVQMASVLRGADGFVRRGKIRRRWEASLFLPPEISEGDLFLFNLSEALRSPLLKLIGAVSSRSKCRLAITDSYSQKTP